MVRVCLDVHYRENEAVAAALLFTHWSDSTASGRLVTRLTNIEPYVPGQFFRRELPCLLEVLRLITDPIETIVVDGYVWLEDESRPGLGAHLYSSLHGNIPVIGVAKTQFRSARVSVPVVRGTLAHRPLHVTSVGIPLEEAAANIRSMHGPHRLPDLLREVDHLCRQESVRLDPRE